MPRSIPNLINTKWQNIFLEFCKIPFLSTGMKFSKIEFLMFYITNAINNNSNIKLDYRCTSPKNSIYNFKASYKIL